MSKGHGMTIGELAALTGVAARQIRYLIAEGFIPPPAGGRARATYGEDHAAGIRRYMRLRDCGFPPAAIKLLLETREGAPIPIVPGITLVVDPAFAAGGGAVEPIVARVREALTEFLREPDDGPERHDPHD
jgi:DNA-binding transcriptional MerR regulator